MGQKTAAGIRTSSSLNAAAGEKHVIKSGASAAPPCGDTIASEAQPAPGVAPPSGGGQETVEAAQPLHTAEEEAAQTQPQQEDSNIDESSCPANQVIKKFETKISEVSRKSSFRQSRVTSSASKAVTTTASSTSTSSSTTSLLNHRAPFD